MALCVHPEEEYVKVKMESDGTVYYLAHALADTILKGEYTVLQSYRGKDLENTEYEPLFHFVSPKEKCWYVTCDTVSYTHLDVYKRQAQTRSSMIF